MRSVFEGLQILLKYCEKDLEDELFFSAAHDEVWAGGPEPSALAQEDVGKLHELGWSYDESLGSWHKWV